MGKPDVFLITFTENKRVYYPGEMVTGNVVTKSRKKLKFRSIRMEFHGETRVVKTGSKEWVKAEEYFDEKVEICGKEDSLGGSYPIVEPGEHLFPFHFQIPHRRLPSSFEGKFGCIRYWLKATMDRPWKSNYNSKSAVTILEVVDINEPWALEPLVIERELQTHCMCFNSGTIVGQIRTDRRGYCPGEAIALSGGFCNYTSSRSKPISVSLYQKTTYNLQGKNKKTQVSKCVKANKDKCLMPNVPFEWLNQMFSIPAIAPTIQNCRFIKVSYSLVITVEANGNILSLDFPVTIGSVPYRPLLIATAPPMLALSPLPSAPPMDLPSYSESMSTPQRAPPTYAECVFGSTRLWDATDAASGDMMGDTSFTPMYAFVSNYQFLPATGSAIEEVTTTRVQQIDAIDDGLSDSMDEENNY